MDSVDTNGDPIVPIVKQKVLIKPFPIDVVSDWKTQSPLNLPVASIGPQSYLLYNPSQSLGKYAVEYSYTPFDSVRTSSSPGEADAYIANFRYVYAKTKLTDVTIKIRNLNAALNIFSTSAPIETFLIIRWGNSFLAIDSLAEVLAYHLGAFTETSDFTFTIPVIEQNQSIYIYFLTTKTFGAAAYSIDITSMDIEITATSIGIASVSDAARYEDFIAKGVESACGLPINAPDLITGEYKDQFVWTGNDMRQKAESLPCVLKNELEDLREMGMDWQTNTNAVEIAKYEDFYPDNFLGHYGDIAPTDFEELQFNPRAKVINLNNQYKNYEKADQSVGTNQSFHTELQLLFPNNQVENDIKIQINHTRDPLRIENTRRKIILQTTAQETDNEIFIAPFVQIAPGTKDGFTAGLQHNVLPDGRVQILNRAASDDSIGNFDWTLLGFGLGSPFTFTIFGVDYTYTVTAPLDRNILTLTPVSLPVSVFIGFTMTKVEYPFTNVLYAIQTKEGFDQVLNLNNQGEGANLFYTQKRNLLRLGSLLHTICLDSLKYPTCQIQVKGFKNNGKLVTQYNGGAVITEDAPILMTDLPAPRIDTGMIKTRFGITMAEAKSLINRATMRNPDGTIGGYITTPDKSGRAVPIYMKDMLSVWAQGFMEIAQGEVKFEQQPTTISKVGTDIYIQQSGFPTVPVADANNGWFEVLNGYFIAYSAGSRQLITPVPYRSVSVDGVMYVDLVEFLDAVGVVYSYPTQ